ncbi:MAG: HAD family hydrolase [Microvirga sp.]
MPITLIGLDADDTLWHNESIFRATQGRFYELLAPFGGPDVVEARLAEVEHRNLGTYGYGAKGFTLSMIETALAVSGGRVDGLVVEEILAAGRRMMTHPVEPLPRVTEALEALSARARLVLITKGDLFHQEAKLAASGLGGFFSGVEIVSDKTAATYDRIFRRYDAAPEESLMAGNSVRSDILPALEAGAHAALVPYPLVWSHEAAEAPAGHPRFRELATLAELPGWVEELP